MKKKTNRKKKCYSYTNTKRNNKHNINVSPYYKNNNIVLNKTVNKNFDVILTKLNELIKKMKSKNIQIKRNVKDISNIKNKIENSKNRNLRKQKEIISLQNQINHKQFKKNEIVNICCPYFNLLENNNVLLNQQIEELFLREIYIRKKELALKQILFSCSLNNNTNKSHHKNMNSLNYYCNNGNHKINNNYHNINNLTSHTFQYNQINIITKHDNSMCVYKRNNHKLNSTISNYDNTNMKKTSSLPDMKLNKEQLEIINKTFLNYDEFHKLLSQYKSKTQSLSLSNNCCKELSFQKHLYIDNHNSNLQDTNKNNSINMNGSRMSNINHNIRNNNKLNCLNDNSGSSFHSQFKGKFPFNNYKRNKRMNSNKEILKKFLLGEGKENLSTTSDKANNKTLSSRNNQHINKSKSNVIINNNRFRNNSFQLSRYFHNSYIDSKNTITNNKNFLLKIKDIIYKRVRLMLFPLLISFKTIKREYIQTLLSNTLIKKFFIYKLIVIFKQCSTDLNNKIQNQSQLTVDDFINEEDIDVSSSQENMKIEKYMDKLNKFKQLTSEMKQIESNMKQFIDHVYDN